MPAKCDKCNKQITKSIPGVECSKCECIVHLNTKCTGLSNKQITALKAAPSLEWTCLQCQSELPKRKSSIIVPDDNETDEDDEDAKIHINAQKLLTNISVEVEKAIKKELREFNESLQFHSAKLDEVVELIEMFKKNIKSLERKNIELTNKNTNLEYRVGAMEQRLQELEQEKLNNFVEITNLVSKNNEDAKKGIENIAIKLNLPRDGIKSTTRLHERKGQPPNILVELKSQDIQENWLKAARKTKIMVADVNEAQESNNSMVYINEAITKYNKQLFWNAKQELKTKMKYKYVWFRRGILRVRKDDEEKVYTIRSLNDLQSIAANTTLSPSLHK